MEDAPDDIEEDVSDGRGRGSTMSRWAISNEGDLRFLQIVYDIGDWGLGRTSLSGFLLSNIWRFWHALLYQTDITSPNKPRLSPASSFCSIVFSGRRKKPLYV